MDFEVASFWSGSDLSYFEHLSMKSFVDKGYKFHLFTKGPVDNIPDYVEHHDAGDIYQQSDIKVPICDIQTAFTKFGNTFFKLPAPYRLRKRVLFWDQL